MDDKYATFVYFEQYVLIKHSSKSTPIQNIAIFSERISFQDLEKFQLIFSAFHAVKLMASKN